MCTLSRLGPRPDGGDSISASTGSGPIFFGTPEPPEPGIGPVVGGHAATATADRKTTAPAISGRFQSLRARREEPLPHPVVQAGPAAESTRGAPTRSRSPLPAACTPRFRPSCRRSFRLLHVHSSVGSKDQHGTRLRDALRPRHREDGGPGLPGLRGDDGHGAGPRRGGTRGTDALVEPVPPADTG